MTFLGNYGDFKLLFLSKYYLKDIKLKDLYVITLIEENLRVNGTAILASLALAQNRFFSQNSCSIEYLLSRGSNNYCNTSSFKLD